MCIDVKMKQAIGRYYSSEVLHLETIEKHNNLHDDIGNFVKINSSNKLIKFDVDEKSEMTSIHGIIKSDNILIGKKF